MANAPTTHSFIEIEEIKEGVLVTRQKNMRAVLMVSSINFDLKSAEEKEALVYAFQRFINSLDFPIQVVIHSRPLDLSEYFVFLREQQETQENELLKIQTTEYVNFVTELVQLSNIMSKFFYVVVPYDTVLAQKGGVLDKLFSRKKGSEEAQQQLRFEEARNQLLLRVNQVASLLGEMELRSVLLDDQQLLELFYSLYNPGTTLKQKNMELLIATGKKEKQVE
jgi:hypothetical protein